MGAATRNDDDDDDDDAMRTDGRLWSKSCRVAMARVALACRVAKTSERHGSNERALANKTVDVPSIPCASFLAVR